MGPRIIWYICLFFYIDVHVPRRRFIVWTRRFEGQSRTVILCVGNTIALSKNTKIALSTLNWYMKIYILQT